MSIWKDTFLCRWLFGIGGGGVQMVCAVHHLSGLERLLLGFFLCLFLLLLLGGHGDNFKTTGEQTNFKDCGSTCSSLKHPWAAPGRAPNLGGGCGIFWGNPYGCPAHDDQRPPGSDCGDTSRGFDSRGTWSYGASALEIDFPQAKNTEWARGSDQWVGWIAKGGHWGGYTYRLCKLPKEGKSGLTEECFAKNVLEFAKPKTWWKRAGDEHVNDAWQTVSKTDLVEGTYPEGSAWRPGGSVQETNMSTMPGKRFPK